MEVRIELKLSWAQVVKTGSWETQRTFGALAGYCEKTGIAFEFKLSEEDVKTVYNKFATVLEGNNESA